MIKRQWNELAAKLKLPRVELLTQDRSTPRESSPMTVLYMMLVPLGILLVVGLLMGFSSQVITHTSAGESGFKAVIKPVILLVAALIAGTIAAVVPAQWYRRFALHLWLFSLFLQSLVKTPLGASEGGNTNWIRIPGIPFLIQPSEFLKLTLIIVLAAWIARPGTRIHDLRQMLVVAIAPIVVSFGAVMLGHDLGTGMVVVATAMCVLIVAGIPWKWVGTLAAASPFVLAGLVLANPTRIARLKAVIPGFAEERDLSKAQQIDHSLWAFGSGGIFGLGPGASREKWSYLQAAHTDFILAIVGEEFGLLGSVVIVGCLLALVLGIVRLARSVDNQFQALVASGVAAWIGLQTVVNVATVTGLGPVIGVTLPFISSGGSSLVFTTLAMGVVLSFAREHAGLTRAKRLESGTFGRDPRISPTKRSARRL